MTKKVVFLITSLLFILPNVGHTSGQAIYKKAKCFDCHGDMGQGNQAKEAPRIAGQHDWYILASLKAFKSKKRKNPEMYPYIRNLSDKDFQALAEYLSKL